MPGKFIQIGTQAAAPLVFQRPNDSPVTVTLYAQALTFHSPFLTWIWSRPSTVERHDGQGRSLLPIPDITRSVQLGAAALNILFLATALYYSISRRKVRDGDRK